MSLGKEKKGGIKKLASSVGKHFLNAISTHTNSHTCILYLHAYSTCLILRLVCSQ